MRTRKMYLSKEYNEEYKKRKEKLREVYKKLKNKKIQEAHMNIEFIRKYRDPKDIDTELIFFIK